MASGTMKMDWKMLVVIGLVLIIAWVAFHIPKEPFTQTIQAWDEEGNLVPVRLVDKSDQSIYSTSGFVLEGTTGEAIVHPDGAELGVFVDVHNTGTVDGSFSLDVFATDMPTGNWQQSDITVAAGNTGEFKGFKLPISDHKRGTLGLTITPTYGDPYTQALDIWKPQLVTPQITKGPTSGGGYVWGQYNMYQGYIQTWTLTVPESTNPYGTYGLESISTEISEKGLVSISPTYTYCSLCGNNPTNELRGDLTDGYWELWCGFPATKTVACWVSFEPIDSTHVKLKIDCKDYIEGNTGPQYCYTRDFNINSLEIEYKPVKVS